VACCLAGLPFVHGLKALGVQIALIDKQNISTLIDTLYPGAMVPFSSQEDVDFFSHLELHLRQEHPPLAGRDHMAFRGSYYPVRAYGCAANAMVQDEAIPTADVYGDCSCLLTGPSWLH
jgi:hypothetical protein